MTVSQPSDIFQPGDVLNNTYRIETILGRGGTSEVYKARSEISGRVIAIKALRAEFSTNDDFLVLMTREEDIRDVRHDAIVRYFDTQRMPDGVVYLVMDFVDGPGLDRKLADGGMSASDLMIVGARVCEGLITAHGRNIVHRDLSPDNIILRNDAPGEAVIIDFGIAKDTNPGAETIVGNEFAGKYAYAAPEQLSGRTDPRSDIYSLGALLLSTFRGEKPDMGRNPMEVIEKKAKPLDLDGVPEPLRSLIARMSDPDPDRRFADAESLLAAFKDPSSIQPPAPAADPDPLDDATVIVAPSAARAAAKPVHRPVAEPAPSAAARNTPDAAKSAKRSSGLIPVVAVLLLALAGAGGYFGGVFDGLLGPRYPLANPFALVVEKSFGGEAQAVGNVPSEEIETALSNRMNAMGGSAQLTLASGDIAETWGDAVLTVLDRADHLDEFRLVVSNGNAALSGLASSRSELETIQAAFEDGLPAGLQGKTDLQLGPRFVTPDMLVPLLLHHADCGRLQLRSPPQIGYGLEDRIIVTGRFAEDSSRDALRSEIAEVAGDRPVRIEAEILNPSLCQVDAILPRVGSGGFVTRFGFGDREGENLSGRYQVGDNPVIDIILPDSVQDGFLWVSVVDVKGVVFHALPNRNRPDNSVATLRTEAQDGALRVAFGLEEAQGTGRVAFTVDDSILGKSKLLVLHSRENLFPDLRPTTESVSSYAQALAEARDRGGLQVTSLDTAILTTEE